MRKKAIKRPAGRPPLTSVPALGSAILEAAAKLFLSKGFPATTMRQIAEEARVSPQTLYARFDDKAQLFAALMESRTTALLGRMAAPFEDAAPPQEALQAFGITLLSTFLSTDLQQLHQMVIAESNTFPTLAHAFFTAGPDRGRKLLIAYLHHSVSAGSLQIPDVEVAAEQFIGALVGNIVIRSTLAQPAKLIDQKGIAHWVSLAVQAFLGAYGSPPLHPKRVK